MKFLTARKGQVTYGWQSVLGYNRTRPGFSGKKVQKAIESSKNHPLDGEVHVDEFEIGTPQKDEQGRAHIDRKVRVV